MNGDLIDALVADKRKRGELDISNHPLTRPAMIESESIKRFSTIGASLEYPVHIVHVSSKEGGRRNPSRTRIRSYSDL